MKRTLILQHASFEKPGYLLEWLEKHQLPVDILHLNEAQAAFPALETVKMLIIMGAPMSVHDETEYPWLIQEKNFIRQAIENHIPTLGICFGAQLIANIYKANVYPMTHKEIGWFPIKTLKQPDSAYFQFPSEFISFLWHGEQFDIPENASPIGFSQACPNQGFQLNRNTIGLQFHPEMTRPLIQEMLDHARENEKQNERQKTPFIQNKQEMLSAPAIYFSQNQQLVDQLMTYLMEKA